MCRLVRYLLSIILIIAIAFSVAGCREKPVARQAVTKDELIIALDRYSGGKKPPDGLGVDTCTQIYEPLLFLNKKLEIQPGLITFWERLDDLTWRFKLRKGVKFHNGKEFNAESAKFAFTVYLDKAKTSYTAQRVKQVVNHNSFEVIDKYTLQIKTIKPYPFLPNLMTHPCIVAMDPEAFKKGEIVGTGPFKFKEEAKDQYVVVERNDEYWGEKPYFKRIVFKIVPDENTRAMALQSGEADVIVYPPYPLIAELAKKYSVITAPRGPHILLFNLDRPYLKDVRVRKALSVAFDREEVAKRMFYGYAEPAKSLVPPGLVFSVAKARGWTYDPVMAKKLLEEAGFKDSDGNGYYDWNGRNLELKLAFFADDHDNKSIAEIIAYGYRNIGVKTEIAALESAAYETEILKKGNYDICLDSTGIFWGSPSTMLYDHFYSKSGLTGFHRLKDAEIDRLMEEGMELESRRDLVGANEKYEALQMRALDELASLSVIDQRQHVIVLKKEVVGLAPFPAYSIFYNGFTENNLVKARWEGDRGGSDR